MVTIKSTASGKEYGISKLESGYHQYMDRAYQFDYIPDSIRGCVHIMTCGSDKMFDEHKPCFTITCDHPCDVYVLYADKQPVLPEWLHDYERMRMNVTRLDTMCDCLKGYFSLYKKSFPAGDITFYGNSPSDMLKLDWYCDTRGTNYCMYTVAIVEKNEFE